MGAARRDDEDRLRMLAELQRPETLRRAWESVAANGGSAGIDRVSVAAFRDHLEAKLGALAAELRSGAYRALPVLRVRPRFLATSDRALVVPAVRDRVVQRAVADLLTPRVEPLLSPACRAFRRGHSAKTAADDVGRWVAEGTPWVLRADVRGFYDHIRPERLHVMLEPLVDADGLRFLDRLVRCRIFDRDAVSEMVQGIAQGSPLSPLLGATRCSPTRSPAASRPSASIPPSASSTVCATVAAPWPWTWWSPSASPSSTAWCSA